jgi:hypothetical protein
MIIDEYWTDEGNRVELFGPHSAEPRPTTEVLSALYTLRHSEWFGQECENANHHSLDGWLLECAELAEEELELVKQNKVTNK